MKVFKNKVMLITGANRGIGKSLVKTALAAGAAKIYATSRSINNLPDFMDKRVIPIKLDITDTNQIREVVTETADIQILINNAGVLSQGTILEGDLMEISNDMNVNYFGTLNMMKAFAPILIKNSPSRIINIVSIVAYSPLPSIAEYSASKAALLSATHSARTELSKKGVLVHSVNPGAIDTDMNKGSDWNMPHPDEIANIIFEKVADNQLDIIPDEMGQGMHNAWQEDPLKLANMFSDMFHGE